MMIAKILQNKNPKSKWGCSMEDRKVYCNSCPCFAPPNNGPVMCGISGWDLYRHANGLWGQDEADCPLRRIELKDGTTYVPEIVGD